MALKTKDTSILMQHLIAMKAKRETLAVKLSELQEQLFNLDDEIAKGVDILLQADKPEEEAPVEVTRVMQR